MTQSSSEMVPYANDTAPVPAPSSASAPRSESISSLGLSASMREGLGARGPVATSFARYLSTRADVVPAGLRAALASCADLTTPAPASEVRALLDAAWGARVSDVCFDFEDAPVEVCFPTQTHRAWLAPTHAVLVRVVPPQFLQELERGLRSLRDSRLFTPVLDAEAYRRLVADFEVTLRRRVSQAADLAAASSLVADARRFPQLRAARPHPALSRDHVCVLDEVVAIPLDTPGLDRPDEGAGAFRAWLRQALLGGVFPEEVEPTDLVLAGRRQISLRGRLFARLDADAQADLSGYIVAVAAADPDLAMRYLQRQLVPGRTADAAGLQRRLRHAWSIDGDAAGDSELLAQLLLHWQIAVDHGFTPRPALVAFLRGATSAVRAARHIGAVDDVLADALGALQLRVMASQLEAITGVSPSNARSAREAGWRLITTLSAGPVDGMRGPRPSGAPLHVFGSLLLVLAALGVAMPRLISAGASWADPIGAVLFAGLGGSLLFVSTRRRGGH